MAGVRMSAPKGRVRIDRQRGEPRGYAHQAEEQRLPPPGHAERLAAHEARVARDLARLEMQWGTLLPCEPRPKTIPSQRLGHERRARLVLILASAGGRMRKRSLREAARLKPDSFSDLLQPLSNRTGLRSPHPWFRLIGWHHASPRGEVALTPAGRAEAQRLAREGGSHADQ